MIKNKNYELYSFDVFDTLITRTTFNPYGIFLLMQNELLFNKDFSDFPDYVKKNFKILRMGAESFLSRTKKYKKLNRILTPTEIQQEFSLEEFYALMGKRHGLTAEQKRRLIELEVITEIKNSVPIKENIKLLKELISSGKRVVLISDMYLPEFIIRKILSQHDTVFDNIKIYVSSEYRERKSTGKLYHLVAKEENISDYKKWLHIGDNKYSDIEAAKKLKIHTLLYPQKNITEFEEKFYSKTLLSISPEAQVMLASSVQTRQFFKDAQITNLATSATTILYPYVKWLINKSLEMEISRLYFIARDGYVLKEIADVIIKQDGIRDLSTHYIYGSRDAWRIPSCKTYDDISFVFNVVKDKLTLSHIAYNLGIEVDKLKRFLNDKTLTKPNEPLSYDKLNTIRSMLNKPEFISFILDKTETRKELLVEYLKQNIDFSDDKFAFVDLTSAGITGCLLANLINDKFKIKSKNFVISLSRDIENDNVIFYDFNQIQYSAGIVEVLCRAPHGMTVGYKNINGKILPILDNSEKFEKFDQYIDAIKTQTELLNYAINTNKFISLDDFSYAFMYEILQNCTSDTAKCFSSVQYSSMGVIKNSSINKKSLNFIDVLNYYFLKRNISYATQVNFALKNSNMMVRGLASVFEKYPQFNLPKIKNSLKQTKTLIKTKF